MIIKLEYFHENREYLKNLAYRLANEG